MKRDCLNGKQNGILQVCFLYCWLVNLVGTDSFYSSYLLVGLIVLHLLLTKAGDWGNLTQKENIWISSISVFFSVAMILANYQLFGFTITGTILIRLIGSLAGGYIIGRNLLICLLKRSSTTLKPRSVPEKVSPGTVFIGVSASAALIDILYLVTSAYPGVLSYDSLATVRQILSGSYNNIMPFWHTMTVQVFLKLGLMLFGDINAAVATFHVAQILFLSACFGYAVVTMYQAGVPGKYVVMMALVYVLAPYNIVYSVTLWKDVLFGSALLLLTTALFRIIRGIGRNQLLNYILLVIGAIGFSVWRTNGWYALVATVVMFFLAAGHRKKAFVWILAAVLVLCWILLNPVLAALGGDEMDLIEILAVPFQQIARYVVTDGWMDEYERDFLSQAFDLEKVKRMYHPHVVDALKFLAFRRDNLEYIKENLKGYLQLYIQFGLRSPETYLEAWIEITKGYWSLGYPDPMYELGVNANDFGIVHSGGGNGISSLFSTYFDIFQWTHILEPVCSIGLHVWAAIACCVVNILKKRSEFLLSIPLIVLAVGLWLGAPVVAEFRYGYPMILTAPLLLLGTLYPEDRQQPVSE